MRIAVWASVVLACSVAHAQPADPYAPAPKPAAKKPAAKKPAAKKPAPADAPADPYADAAPDDPYAQPASPPAPVPPGAPVPPSTPTAPDLAAVDEQVAQSLVQRAQELFAASMYVDAKQLALEALGRAPTGEAGTRARQLVRDANKQLGLPDERLPGDPAPEPVAEPEPAKQPEPVAPPIVAPPPSKAHVAARVHGGLYLGTLGAMIGSFASDEAAIPGGLAGALAGVLLAPTLERKLDISEAQLRTVGSGSVWGGVIGGFMGDAVRTRGTTPSHVLLGASIGSTIGGLAGAGIASQQRFTRGDVALVDTFAGIGTVGGLTLGMLMQPAEGEAYSVNAIVGAAAGYLTGYIAAPLTNTTPRRMLRVLGASAVGGAAPFLLYAAMYDESTSADERTVGFLSTAGLVIGAYVGFRLTRDLDADLDTHDGKKKRDSDELTRGIVHRHASGAWTLGTLTVQPLSLELAPQPGMALPVVGGSW